jgi:oligoribonuclease NrnB/cAMP/cGMP phosphodiesterase (DHH superfamily)
MDSDKQHEFKEGNKQHELKESDKYSEFKSYPFKHDYPELVDKYSFEKKNLTVNKSKINFVVTHANCTDGFMSATVVRLWMKKNGINIDNVTFYSAYMGADFTKLPELMKDKYVVICDFSFQKTLFSEMIAATNGNILILDHHKTAQKNLQDIKEEYLTFDMTHSGAFLTWVYFFGFNNVPKAILYVEDNDIWIKALPFTKEFTAHIYQKDFEYDAYEKYFDDCYLTETVFPIGSGMIIQNDMICSQLAKKCIPNFLEINGRYYFAACLNSMGILKSELGNHVLGIYKHANFSMIYAHEPFGANTTISYRSMNDRTDTTEIAKIQGGGGHRNASGAFAPHKIDNPPGRLLDSYRAYYMLDNVYTRDINERKFILLNTACTGKHLIQYLLQERYFNDEHLSKNKTRLDKNLPGFQEGLFCRRNNLNNPDLDEVYSGAIAWFYDGANKKYNMIAKFLPNVLNETTLKALLDNSSKAESFMESFAKVATSLSITTNNDMLKKYILKYEFVKPDMHKFSFSDGTTIEEFLTMLTANSLTFSTITIPIMR